MEDGMEIPLKKKKKQLGIKAPYVPLFIAALFTTARTWKQP